MASTPRSSTCVRWGRLLFLLFLLRLPIVHRILHWFHPAGGTEVLSGSSCFHLLLRPPEDAGALGWLVTCDGRLLGQSPSSFVTASGDFCRRVANLVGCAVWRVACKAVAKGFTPSLSPAGDAAALSCVRVTVGASTWGGGIDPGASVFTCWRQSLHRWWVARVQLPIPQMQQKLISLIDPQINQCSSHHTCLKHTVDLCPDLTKNINQAINWRFLHSELQNKLSVVKGLLPTVNWELTSNQSEKFIAVCISCPSGHDLIADHVFNLGASCEGLLNQMEKSPCPELLVCSSQDNRLFHTKCLPQLWAILIVNECQPTS